MEWIKRQLMTIRWGDQLTKEDYFLAKSMTLKEIWMSSFMLPKTPMTRHSKTLRRR